MTELPETEPLEMELPCLLRTAALEEPHAPAIAAPDVELSYGELDRLVDGTARRLASAGLTEGGRLALLQENTWEMLVLMLAAVRVGAVACPLSRRLPDAAAREACRRLGVSIVVSDRDLPGAVAPEELLNRDGGGPRGRREAESLPADRPATIVYTSGSTGSARAALLTYGNHYFSAAGSNRNIALEPGDRWLLSLPLYHVGGIGILFRCLLARAVVVMPPAGAALADLLPGVTHVSMVATQLRRLLGSPRPGLPAEFEPASVFPRGVRPTRAVLLGGSAIPGHLIEAALDYDLPVHTSYGLTETASQVATTPSGAALEDLRTSGYVLPHRELRIDGDGRILVRGRTRFVGYVDGHELVTPFDAEGWFRTGDLGRLDEAGRLIVLGRADNVFISGGENIRPEEIEAVLGGVRGVERVVVVPVDDREYGQRPVAFVEVSGEVDRKGEIDEKRLRDAVQDALPRFMVPDAFYPWPDAGGQSAATSRLKVDRAWFRQRAAALGGSG